MSESQSRPRGFYFEEFSIGQRIITTGRTVTETDIVSFAGLSGDFNQIHTDTAYAEKSPFGQRVAHGLLGLSIASGLVVQSGMMEGTILAFREINEWKFVQPIYIGDTIYVEVDVMETKELRRLGGGAIVISLDVKKHPGETVMKGIWKALVSSRPA